MDFIKYANQGATRNKPLSPELLSALGFLNDMGVTVEVFSGGQDAIGQGGRRTGSTRHDHGNAADVFFYKDGRRLDWSNPADIPVFQQIVAQGRAAGLTGFGAGDGYMQPGSMHIGFGPEAVWGAGGKSAAAPDWLREAYYGASAGPGAVTASYGGQNVLAASPMSGPAQPANALAMQEPPRPQIAMNLLDPRAFMTAARMT